MGNICGASWHGVFESDAFRRAFLSWVAEARGLDWSPGSRPFAEVREARFDLLGDLIERHADTDGLIRLIGEGPPRGLPVVRAGTWSGSGLPGTEETAVLQSGAVAPLDLRFHGDRMVPAGHLDFAVNVIPQDPPPGWLRKEMDVALDRVSSYPDESEAVNALADRHGRSPGEVLPTNGAAEAFWLLAAALRPRHAVVVHPTFTEPEAALRAFGRPVGRAFRRPDDFALDPTAVPESADLVVLGNPNNPTGTLDPAGIIERLVFPGRVLVVDEAFMEFVPGEAESMAARAGLRGLVVVRSLTKAWSVPGIRAGYLLAPVDLVTDLRATRQPWAVNALALAALGACARDQVTSRKVSAEVAAAREGLRDSLSELPGARVWPSAANFLLVRVPGGPTIRQALLERGIAVRPAGTFPVPHPRSPPHRRAAAGGEQAPYGSPSRSGQVKTSLRDGGPLLELPTTYRWLSSPVLGGGLGWIRTWLNLQVERGHDCADPETDLLASANGLVPPVIGMLTAAPVARFTTRARGCANSGATVGLRHPIAAAGSVLDSEAVGMVNLLAVVDIPLTDADLANALQTAVEAKAQVLAAAGVPALAEGFGVDPGSIEAILLKYLHDDHFCGLPQNGWAM